MMNEIKHQKCVFILRGVFVIVGLAAAIALIFFLNHHISVGACADYGGRYMAASNTCVDLESGYKHSLNPTPIMFTAYGLIVLISFLLAKRLADALIASKCKLSD